METRILYAKSIYKIQATYRLNIYLLLCLHIFHKILDTGLLQTCEMGIFSDYS